MKKIYLIAISLIILTACQQTKTEPEINESKFIDENLTGEIPFDYETTETTAENGDYILTPNEWTFRQIFVSDPNTVKFVFHPAKMLKKDLKISEVEYLNGDRAKIANSLIIPLTNNLEPENGNIILTWWQKTNGIMTKAKIANTTNEQTTAYFLNDAFGNEESPLLPNSFTILDPNTMSPGQNIAITRNDESKQKGQIINLDEKNQKALILTSDEFIITKSFDEFQPIPLNTEFAVGETILAPIAGIYQPAEITEINEKSGLITCKYNWANQETIENFNQTELLLQQ